MNYTRTATEQYALASWASIALFLTLTNNTYILCTTIYYKAIKIDRLSIWIIQNIAVADILFGTLNILPIAVDNFNGNVWSFGPFLCKAGAVFKETPFTANNYLINLLQLNKIYRCVMPVRSMRPTRRRTLILISVVVAVLSNLRVYHYLIEYYLFNKPLLKYCYFRSLCDMVSNQPPEGVSGVARTLDRVFGVFSALLPLQIMVVLSVVLVLFVLVKLRGKSNKSGVLCILLMTTVFLLSTLSVLSHFTARRDWAQSDVVLALTFLQSFCNVYIYYVTNLRFRRFTEAMLVRCWQYPWHKTRVSHDAVSQIFSTRPSTTKL